MDKSPNMATSAIGQKDCHHENHGHSSPHSHEHSSQYSAGYLPSLKNFDIHAPKLRAYHHLQQLPSSGPKKSIDQMLYTPHDDRKLTSKGDGSDSGESNNSRVSLISLEPHSLSSPLDPPHQEFLKSLGLFPDKPWPFSEETLNEMIRLRIEQEKTKQIQTKNELGSTVSHLLKEAEKYGFSGELIRHLFLENHSGDLKSFTHQFQAIAAHHTPPASEKGKCPPSDSIHTPGHTPNKLPALGALEIQPASTVASQCQSRTLPQLSEHPADHQGPGIRQHHLPLPNQPHALSNPHHSDLKHLPPLPAVPHHLYPVYYPTPAQENPHHSHQPFHQKTSLDESENLGLPYSNKYPTIVFHSLPLKYPEGQAPPGQPHHTQHCQIGQQQYYYVNSSPQGVPGPVVPSQFLIPQPVSSMVPWPASAQGTPAPQLVEKKEEERPLKKAKKSKSGINFMISTPKNPPARKYNKS